MFSEIAESKPFDPTTLLKDCLNRLHANSDVSVEKTSVNNFYTKLGKLPDGNNPELRDLDGSYVACIGGTFRSPRMARYLRQKGVSLADEEGVNGFSMSNMPELITEAQITEEGLLHPKGFNKPIRNLFIGIDTQDEDCQGAILFCTMNALAKKQGTLDGRIKLNIFIVDGDETESASLHRKYRAYDPDLDNPNEDCKPAFPQ